MSDAQIARIDEADELGRFVIQQRVRAHRIGRSGPGVGKPGMNVGFIHGRRARVSAVAIDAAEANRRLVVHIADVLMAGDAALALGGSVGFGLPGKIDADHFRRQWKGIDAAPEPFPAATARRRPEARSLHPTHERRRAVPAAVGLAQAPAELRFRRAAPKAEAKTSAADSVCERSTSAIVHDWKFSVIRRGQAHFSARPWFAIRSVKGPKNEPDPASIRQRYIDERCYQVAEVADERIENVVKTLAGQ